MKNLTILIMFSLVGCASQKKKEVMEVKEEPCLYEAPESTKCAVGKYIDLDACLKGAESCDPNCVDEAEDFDSSVNQMKSSPIELFKCNGEIIPVIDKTDLGDHWMVIPTTGYPKDCKK